MEDKMLILPQLRSPMMAHLHRGHAGLFKMRNVVNSYFWWPHMDFQVHLTAVNCKESVKSGKNLKSVIPSIELVSLDPMEEPNQETQVPGAIVINLGCEKRPTDLHWSVL